MTDIYQDIITVQPFSPSVKPRTFLSSLRGLLKSKKMISEHSLEIEKTATFSGDSILPEYSCNSVARNSLDQNEAEITSLPPQYKSNTSSATDVYQPHIAHRESLNSIALSTQDRNIIIKELQYQRRLECAIRVGLECMKSSFVGGIIDSNGTIQNPKVSITKNNIYIDYQSTLFSKEKKVSMKLFDVDSFKELNSDEVLSSVLVRDITFLTFKASLAHPNWKKTGAGNSGCDIYWSKDRSVLVKSLSSIEIKEGKKIIHDYCKYVKHNSESFLVRYHALIRVKIGSVLKYFLVMSNIFKDFVPSEVYDLKGSFYGRKGKNGSILKDQDLLQKLQTVPREQLLDYSDLERKVAAIHILNDVHFLRSRGIIDYSLLLGFDGQGNWKMGIIDILTAYTPKKKLEYSFFGVLHVSTFYSPDEYWQSIEVSHYYVFRYPSSKELTWEWREGIRTFIYPGIFSIIYWILKLLNLDWNYDLFINAPKVAQGILAGVCDFYTFDLSERIFGTNIARITLALSILSWYHFYSLTRTFANSFETALLTLGLHFMPIRNDEYLQHYQYKNFPLVSFLLGALCCAVRPTACLTWIIFGFNYLGTLYYFFNDIAFIGRQCIFSFLTVLSVLAFVAYVDYLFYEKLIFTPWNFFSVNVLQGISLFYGVNSFHWYVTQGIPVLLGAYVPFFLYGLWCSRHNTSGSTSKVMWVLFGCSIALNSIVAHKEFRFIHFLLPWMIIISSLGLFSLHKQGKFVYFSVVLVALQFFFGIFMATTHQPGVIQVMKYIRNYAEEHEESFSVLFAMPCHSTPSQSHLHKSNVYLRMVSCEPPLMVKDVRTYKDETEIFYQDPSVYLSTYLSNEANTRIIVLFEQLFSNDTVRQILQNLYGFRETKRFFNSLLIDDDRKAESKSIRNSSLHVLNPTWKHFYVWPFVVFTYPSIIYLYLFKFEEYFKNEEVRFLVIGGTFVLNALAFLSCHWSKNIKVAFTCSKASDVQHANVIKVDPVEHSGRSEICPINSLEIATVTENDINVQTQYWFEFQKKKFFYNDDKKIFEKLSYPVEYPLLFYSESKGLTDLQVGDLKKKYGDNKPDIPIPSFQDLMQEHMVAPFFVFQIFCVALWFMDEYWYYSLFTLVMLLVFESTVVFQRLRNLQELRSMTQEPYEIFVYRNHSWVSIKCDALLPGDLVSIVRQKNEEITVPCDLLLLKGRCIMNEAILSGESTPLQKECISETALDELFHIKSTNHKQNIVFGGTKVIQHMIEKEEYGSHVPAPPDGGCIGFVLRTGFGTTQGKLVRTMIYSTERASANNMEAFFFILILVVFALFASAYVWQAGIAAGRKKSKLLLDCIIIVTSVVPPELPLQLSLAVNQSLVALSKMAIFCLEPFRIPSAGKVEICCFDKTGTLTKENLDLEGLVGFGKNKDELLSVENFPLSSSLVISSCHSLMRLDDGLIGNPMEKTVLQAMKLTVTKGDVVKHSTLNKYPSAKIIKRYPFSSALKRMSTLSSIEIPTGFVPILNDETASSLLPIPKDKLFVAVKGAPEVLKTMYKSLPSFYDDIHKKFAMKGSRVLALGYKWITVKSSEIKDLAREKVESELIFAGFLVYHCPLKEDTLTALQELHDSLHRVIMITGDNPLTACHVATQVKILRRLPLIMDADDDGNVAAKSLDESVSVQISSIDFTLTRTTKFYSDVFQKHDLCITGKALSVLQGQHLFTKVLLERIWVYARVSPSQKEYVLTALKSANYTTLMCGDGTNDVGALKQSHVGVALLAGMKEDLEKISRITRLD